MFWDGGRGRIPWIAQQVIGGGGRLRYVSTSLTNMMVSLSRSSLGTALWISWPAEVGNSLSAEEGKK